ncbi:glycosyltransferase family 2 protein [Pseudozobellia sp. WGM2]|uniref:glycosyltransferase family 2 protein n=1 Tax=Pseudozobellia sp. WGM2 TaxID=2787625 RepID=UPI001AE0BC5C|nr:glycosyltransferase family 2 protein [Pseudozobellia sp. WGM2]
MFSVVIPLYNKAHTISRTLQTVLNQTYTNFEVVVVNDGSTDKGVTVIQEFSNDPRIRIVEQENKGVSVARNRGVEESKYDYIAFLDGDDEWVPTYLEKVREAIGNFSEVGMFCTGGVVTSAKETMRRLAKKYSGTIGKVDFFENPHVFVHTSATVVRKQEFFRSGGFPVGMKRNQDYACFFSVALATPVVYIGYLLTTYVGDIAGQATQTSMVKVLPHVINRFNHVHGHWQQAHNPNQTYLVFLRYELRHMLLGYLKKRDYSIIKRLQSGLNDDLIQKFPAFEWRLYTNKALRIIGILYIYVTKIRWRLRGYPYLGE